MSTKKRIALATLVSYATTSVYMGATNGYRQYQLTKGSQNRSIADDYDTRIQNVEVAADEAVGIAATYALFWAPIYAQRALAWRDMLTYNLYASKRSRGGPN